MEIRFAYALHLCRMMYVQRLTLESCFHPSAEIVPMSMVCDITWTLQLSRKHILISI